MRMYFLCLFSFIFISVLVFIILVHKVELNENEKCYFDHKFKLIICYFTLFYVTQMFIACFSSYFSR